MLHSQSNRSLPSAATTATDISESAQATMSREEALALLQSESLKDLNQTQTSKATSKSMTRNDSKSSSSKTKSNLNTIHHKDTVSADSDDFDFPDLSSPDHMHKTKETKTTKTDSTGNSDDDSNDSILDWLDEPRVKPQTKRQPLLSNNNNKKASQKPAKTAEITDKRKMKKDSKFITHSTDSVDVEQWKEWLGLNANNAEDQEFLHLAETASKAALPMDWEKVNDNLYRNIRTNQRTMTHPLLSSMQNELRSLREKKKKQQIQSQQQQQSQQSSSPKTLPANNTTNSTSLSSLTVNTNIPPRQIHINSSIKSQQLTIPPSTTNVGTKKKQMHSTKTQITTIKAADTDTPTTTNDDESTTELYHKQESESLIIKNLRMELGETRKTLTRLMKDKTNLIEEIEELNNKTEILLNEQRQRLSQSHKLEMSQLQKENEELRAMNTKLINDHQTELLELESKIRKDGLKQKQRNMDELTLIEQRGRDELGHQMELHRQTIDELKKQHQIEIESLNNMHQKQLENFRKQNKNEGQLDFLITKMETSTANLHRLQKDIEIERDTKQKERESNIEKKERILKEKDDELLRERKAHRELLEKFQCLVEETKIEKIRIHEAQDKLKHREEQILRELTDSNREINMQRDILNEERRKFELNKSRWEKLKQNELDDIQRLKNEHTKSIQTFYEEQEIERSRLAKQRGLFADERTTFMKMKKEFDVERENLDERQLRFEQEKHKLSMEQSNFERKVQDVTALSRRVYQQSELVTKMYNDSKEMEEQNNTLQMKLISEGKELKIMKQQILMDKHQIESDRKLMEQEQLSLLTTKRDMMQQIDTMRMFELQQQTLMNGTDGGHKGLYDVQNKETLMNLGNTLSSRSDRFGGRKESKDDDREQRVSVLSDKYSLDKINLELKELKDFVNECNLNISNYKEELSQFKNKRISSNTNHNDRISTHFSTLPLSFPSFTSKSSTSFISNSLQNSRSRSLKSLTSTLSSRISGNHHNNGDNGGNIKLNKDSLDKLRMSLDISKQHDKSHDDTINNLSKIEMAGTDHETSQITQTPIMSKCIRNGLSSFNNTDTTLQSSFVSMANIDTPITIDNKTKKYMKRIKESDDEQMPMTPTPMAPMANLSQINVMQQDDDDDIHDFDMIDIDAVNQDEEEDVVEVHGMENAENDEEEKDHIVKDDMNDTAQ